VEAAEFDILHYGLDDAFIQKAARSIAMMPLAAGDLVEAGIRLRRMDGFDIVYLLARSDGRLVATILRVWPERESDRMRKILQGIDLLAMLRGAAGV